MPASYSTGKNGGRPQSSQEIADQNKLQQTQAQVDEVVVIMRENVEKVLERDQRLNELDRRAEALQAGASQFQQNTVHIRRKYWWKNIKMMIILGVVVAVIIIGLGIYLGVTGSDSNK